MAAGGVTIVTSDGTRIKGTIKKLTETGIMFEYFVKSDRKTFDDIGELIAKQQGNRVEREYIFSELKEIDGLKPETYSAFRRNNIFYRAFQEFDALASSITSLPDWRRQITSALVLIGVSIFIIPLIFVLLSLFFKNRLSITGGIGLAVLYTLLIIGIQVGVITIAGNSEFLAKPVGGIATTFLTFALISLLIHRISKFNFLHGMIMCAAWLAGVFSSSNIVQMILSKIN